MSDLLERNRIGDGDVAQGVEELDRPLQFLVEEFAHVGRAHRAARKEHALRRVAIKTDRARNLCVETRHGVADDLRDARHFRVGSFRIGAAETNERIMLLAQLGRAERLAEFFRDRGGDRAAADRDAAAENFAGFDEKQVGGARTDVANSRAVRCS